MINGSTSGLTVCPTCSHHSRWGKWL